MASAGRWEGMLGSFPAPLLVTWCKVCARKDPQQGAAWSPYGVGPSAGSVCSPVVQLCFLSSGRPEEGDSSYHLEGSRGKPFTQYPV